MRFVFAALLMIVLLYVMISCGIILIVIVSEETKYHTEMVLVHFRQLVNECSHKRIRDKASYQLFLCLLFSFLPAID